MADNIEIQDNPMLDHDPMQPFVPHPGGRSRLKPQPGPHPHMPDPPVGPGPWTNPTPHYPQHPQNNCDPVLQGTMIH